MADSHRTGVKQLIKRILPVAELRGMRNACRVGLFWPALRAQVMNRPSRERIGSEYGGWTIPRGVLSATSICYCAGCGEDISFDLGLIARYGCKVLGFDPTPRSMAYVSERVKSVSRYQFIPVGIWNKEARVRFYAPGNPAYVSHSLANLDHTTGYFEAETVRVTQVMRTHGHASLSLLKLDIEGAECDVINSILDEGLSVPILAVEFDHFNQKDWAAGRLRIRDTVQRLTKSGYGLFHVESANFTFVRQPGS